KGKGIPPNALQHMFDYSFTTYESNEGESFKTLNVPPGLGGNTVAGMAEYDNKARGAPQGPDMSVTVPSLSNLAQLTGNDTSLQLDFEDPQASPASSK
ncbi:hypothetical protein OXX59_010629, partial [Metschnikowia pulcherrima]